MAARHYQPYEISTVLLPGVELSGTYYPAQSGDRDTPAVASHVPTHSLKVIGPPHLVREWISDLDEDRFDDPLWLESMADDLRTNHEEYIEHLGEYP
jgi:hypothetical protein